MTGLNLQEALSDGLEPAQLRLLGLVGAMADRLGYGAYLVGGPVRDLLLARTHLDLDVVVEGDGVAVALALARQMRARCVIHERFYTATLSLPEGRSLDVATARSETYERPGALPRVRPAPLAADLQRRDFSINAMAISLRPGDFGRLYDPYRGRKDLADRTLRVLHRASFLDDPTRIIRAIAFQVRFGVRPDPETAALAEQAIGRGALATVSAHRVGEALLPLLANTVAVAAVQTAWELRVLQRLGLVEPSEGEAALEAAMSIPEALCALGLPTHGRTAALAYLATLSGGSAAVAAHTCSALALGRREAMLLGDAAASVATAGGAIDEEAPANSALFFALESANAPGLAALWALSPRGPRRANIERFWRELRGARADITGHDLIGAGFAPSPRFAGALRAALTLRLDCPLAGAQAQLEAAMRAMRDSAGDWASSHLGDRGETSPC